MTEHPPSHRLEALAAGDPDPDAEAHVADCEACREYLDALREELGAWRSSPERERGLERLREAQPAGSNVRYLRWASIVAAPLLVAAAVMLFIGRKPPPAGDGTSAVLPATAPSGGGLRFKGPPQVAVVVEHAGEQHRFTGPVVVRAGDRLRVEVSVARSTPIAAGVLTRDHHYVPLLLPAELDAGTHYSEKAAQFDAEPTTGWVIVGSPDAVRAAQATGQLSGVTALPLSYASRP
jgi:hypothetical protein